MENITEYDFGTNGFKAVLHTSEKLLCKIEQEVDGINFLTLDELMKELFRDSDKAIPDITQDVYWFVPVKGEMVGDKKTISVWYWVKRVDNAISVHKCTRQSVLDVLNRPSSKNFIPFRTKFETACIFVE